MDSVPSQFCQSLATLTKVGDCAIAFQMGSLIYNSRNELARKAVQAEADYVLWLDSDMVFSPDVLKRLLNDREHGDIITGVYYRRVEPYAPVIFDELEITDDGCHWKGTENIPDEIFEIQGCGFGCVLTPTDIFMAMMQKYGNMFAPIAGVGEDLSFCWRARQLGYKIVCDPTIQLGHVGHYVVDKGFYNAYREARKEKQ